MGPVGPVGVKFWGAIAALLEVAKICECLALRCEPSLRSSSLAAAPLLVERPTNRENTHLRLHSHTCICFTCPCTQNSPELPLHEAFTGGRARADLQESGQTDACEGRFPAP